MWTCSRCGMKMTDEFTDCWRCATPKEAPPDDAAPPPAPEPPRRWRADYRVFRATIATWDDLFGQAAEFATELGPRRVINISHSEDRNNGVVTVWFWTADDDEEAPGSA